MSYLVANPKDRFSRDEAHFSDFDLHCIGPRGISVQFVVDLFRGDRFVAVKNHTVKMCTYSSFDYVLDFNLSISASS